MAQTGYTPIQHYYSITGGNTPTTGNLTLGEIAINVADQKVYMLNSASNAVVTLVGTLGNQNANSVSITGGSVNGTTIGASTASTGAFTTISASGVITSTVSTGTAPFTVSSTTQVANLNSATAGTATNATNTAITDNTSSSATWYPTIVSATTGNLPQTTSSTKLSFVPNTGTLTATSYSGTWTGNTITVPYGGTGLTSITANYIPYGNGTSALNTSSTLTYNGTSLNAGNFVPSSSTTPINGMYLAGSNLLGFSTNTNPAYYVDSSQNVLFGTSAIGNIFSGSVQAWSFDKTDGGRMASSSGTTSATAHWLLYNPNGAVGSVVTTGSSTSFNVVSDRRLKSNIATLTNSGAVIDALQPRTFTWIADNSSDVGFIADEIQQVLPKAVTGQPNAVDAEGKPVYQMIDASQPELIAFLVAEIQSLRARLKAANIA